TRGWAYTAPSSCAEVHAGATRPAAGDVGSTPLRRASWPNVTQSPAAALGAVVGAPVAGTVEAAGRVDADGPEGLAPVQAETRAPETRPPASGAAPRWNRLPPSGRIPGLEVDHSLGPLGHGVDVVGPHSRRKVLPPAVADDGDDDALVDLCRALGGGSHDG